jgi:Fis family transcriptional regulator
VLLPLGGEEISLQLKMVHRHNKTWGVILIEENEIASCVRRSLNRYFKDLDGEEPSEVYDMVLSAVERPLLIFILDRAEGNQTRAAEMLGINRNTLRKKLREHGLSD